MARQTKRASVVACSKTHSIISTKPCAMTRGWRRNSTMPSRPAGYCSSNISMIWKASGRMRPRWKGGIILPSSIPTIAGVSGHRRTVPRANWTTTRRSPASFNISAIERNVRSPTVTIAERIALALGCQIGELLDCGVRREFD